MMAGAATKCHSEKCANCAFEFSVPKSGGKRANRSSLKEPGSKVSSFMAKDENNFVSIQVTEALTEIYKLKWLHLDALDKEKKGEEEEEGGTTRTTEGEESKFKLHLCGKCSAVFSQLYDLYLDFSRLRTAGSFLAKVSDEIDKLIGDFSSLTEAAGFSGNEIGKNGTSSSVNSGSSNNINHSNSNENSNSSCSASSNHGTSSSTAEKLIEINDSTRREGGGKSVTGSADVTKNNGLDPVPEENPEKPANHIETNDEAPGKSRDKLPRRSTRSSARLSKKETEAASNPVAKAPVPAPTSGSSDKPSEAKKSKLSSSTAGGDSKPAAATSSRSRSSSSGKRGDSVKHSSSISITTTTAQNHLPPPTTLPLRFEESVTSMTTTTTTGSAAMPSSSSSSSASSSFMNMNSSSTPDLSDNQLFSSNPNDPYHCPVCGKSFLSEFRLHCHRTYCRAPNEPLSEETSKLKCDLCSFVFASKKSLIRHYQSMHYQTDLPTPSHTKCGVCGLNFTSMKEKDEHVLSHYRPPPNSNFMNGATTSVAHSSSSSSYATSSPSSSSYSPYSSSTLNHYNPYQRDPREVISNMGHIAVGLVHAKAFKPFDGTHFLSGVDSTDNDEDCLYLVPEVTIEEDSGSGQNFMMGTMGYRMTEDDDDDDDDSSSD